MKALTKLQGSIVTQAGQVDAAAAAMNVRAREFLAVGALVALAMTAGQAKADDGPMTPSNCASVGAVVGGVAGGSSGNSTVARTVYAAIGALGGAAAGHWMCNPRPLPSQDSSYDRADSYGGSGSSMAGPSAGKSPLSFSERDRLDAMSKDALDAKYRWKMSLWNIDQAERGGSQAAREAAREVESEARQAFVAKRESFSMTVARLNRGTDGVAPRAVGRYLEVSAALLELDTNSRVSYQIIANRDEQLKNRSRAYSEEADRAASMRNRS